MPRPAVTVLGLGVLGAGGYYLYSAGGDPKVAEKKFEHDAARASSAIRSELPGRAKEAKTEAKVLGQEAGAKIDSAITSAKSSAADAEKRLGQYASDAEKRLENARKEAGKNLNSAVDTFDKKVGEGAAKLQGQAEQAKGGIMSWFR